MPGSTFRSFSRKDVGEAGENSEGTSKNRNHQGRNRRTGKNQGRTGADREATGGSREEAELGGSREEQ